ncbi:MAG: tetratricopeptide repeat protein [Holophagales bacterium]|nr:tetratricopeptide repeat protein [Holophagales bacterium]MYC11971.1 tetratricopeptide repeat protein [Holophagales bacterium]
MTTKKQAREARRARVAAARAAAARQAEPAVSRPSAISPREKIAAAALVLMVGISFVPAYQAGFVWDDTIFAEQPFIREAAGLKSIWFSPRDIEQEGHYWPVTYTSFWLEHKLWGFEPLGYHVVNVLLHAVNVLLVWWLLRRFAVPGAWVVAAVFAVHPLHVESVAWTIERKDVLSGLFYLTSFLAYVRFTDNGRPERYLLALGLFAAGLLSKTVVVTLPAALLIWHWWQRGRISRPDLLRTAPFFAVGLLIAAADTAFYRTREALALDYSFVERILIAGRALWFYAGKLAWPDDLAVIYPLWEIRSSDVVGWLCVAGAVAVPVVLWRGRDRWGRSPLACVAFYAATLSPALGLIDYGYMQFSLVADRFQYLAGIGLLTLVVAALVRAAGRLPAAGLKTGKILLATALVLLGGLTWRHAANFRDDATLFSHIVSLNPEARDAHLNLSEALIESDRFEESLEASRIAVGQRPDSPGAHSNLGLALMAFDRFEEAEAAFGRTLEIDPRDRNGHQNLGELMKRQGRYDEAVEQYRRALEIDPDFALGWAGLADAHFLAGRHEEAAETARKSLAIDPDSPNTAALQSLLDRAATATIHSRAERLRGQQRPGEALALYREALDLDSRFAPAIAGMGVAFFELERYEEAIETMERALVLVPELPEASSLHRLTGRALQELGRLEEAAEQFVRTLELDPRDTEALDRLAFLRFNAGRYEEALEYYRALVYVNPTDATAHSNLGVALLNLERHADAVRSLERSLELDPGQAVARAALTEVRQRNQDGEL